MEVAMMNNGRPLTKKQTVRLMIGLTILAWATQTLFKQWGRGAEVPATTPSEQADASDEPAEKFVPGTQRYLSGATLEMRSDATVVGGDVTLKQVCRWADHDGAIFNPVGDLVLLRLGPSVPFKSISVEELRGILRDAGVNIAPINFAGATSCTVARSDVEYNQANALQQWIDAKQNPPAEQTDSTQTTTTKPALAAAPTTSNSDESPVKTLREALVADIATRLNLPAESLQVDFKAQDEKVLNLATPLFRYQIDPVRVKTLGNVSWNVSIIGNDGSSKKVPITAEARAWQTQIIAAKPLAFRQVIRAEDLIQRRALVEQISDDPLLTKDQIIGQQAAREIKPGMLFTGKTIDPLQLVKIGQFVTITLDQGTVKIKTVARALEGGSFGETIRVKSEATNDVFQVVLTGPQTGTMNLDSPVATAGQ
jgi:flagella basal body P-ring formation protein FlgA